MRDRPTPQSLLGDGFNPSVVALGPLTRSATDGGRIVGQERSDRDADAVDEGEQPARVAIRHPGRPCGDVVEQPFPPRHLGQSRRPKMPRDSAAMAGGITADTPPSTDCAAITVQKLG